MYSFAVVIYECLSRRRPYEGAALFSIPHAVANGARPSDRHFDISGSGSGGSLNGSTESGGNNVFKPVNEGSNDKRKGVRAVGCADGVKEGADDEEEEGHAANYSHLSQSLRHRNAEVKLKLCGSQYGGNEDSMIKGSLFDIMVECWEQDPKQRPKFKDILRRLESLTEKHFGEIEESDFNRDPIGKGLGQTSMVQLNMDGSDSQRVRSTVRQRHDFDISQIQMGPLIGTGASGEVYLGNLHGTAVAVKRIVIEDMSEQEAAAFEKECRLVQTLRHPNVVLFMGTCMDGESTLIVTELMGEFIVCILQSIFAQLTWTTFEQNMVIYIKYTAKLRGRRVK